MSADPAHSGTTAAVRIDSLSPEAVSELSDSAIAALYARPSQLGPWMRVNFVASVDGAASVDGLSGGLGGDADRRVFDILRELSDVVIVGAGTVRSEGYGALRLDGGAASRRLERGRSPHPVFAIVSKRLDLDPQSSIFTNAPVRPIVITTDASPLHLREPLAAVSDLIIAGENELDPRMMTSALIDRGLEQQHCEGGPALFAALLAGAVVDELCLTVSPLLVGGTATRITAGDLANPSMLQLAHVLVSGQTLLLRYLVGGPIFVSQ